MRNLICITGICLLTLTVWAQTNGMGPNAGPIAASKISSKTAEFDRKSKVTIYRGNVRVDDPRMKLTCDTLTANAPEQGGHIDHIVAEGNVVIDMVDENNQTNHATGDKLVYTYKVENGVTNDLAVLTGNPQTESAQGKIKGSRIIWDRVTGKFEVENAEVEYRPEAAATNSVPNTNNLVPNTNLSGTVTNMPAMTNAPSALETPPEK